MPINKRAMKQWIKALRSGKYKQGSGRLVRLVQRGGEEYCCMGVACEIFMTTKKGKSVLKKDSGRYIYGADRESYGMPVCVSKWLGLDRGEHSDDVKTKHTDSIVNWNDNLNMTFNQIADELELTFLPVKEKKDGDPS